MSLTKSVAILVAVATTHIRILSSSSPPPSSSPVSKKQVNTVDDDDDDSKKWETPSNQWAPFQTKADFTLDVTVLLIFIVCFILGAFLLNYLANRFTRITSTTHDDNDYGGERNRASKQIIKNRDKFDKASGPTLEFSKGMKMAGTESVCAVCLSDFVEGEGIRVLPKCNHGFHINCIEKWLLNFKTSCPTCRTNCLNSSVPMTKTDFFDDESCGDVESGSAATELAVISSSSRSSSSSTAAAAAEAEAYK